MRAFSLLQTFGSKRIFHTLNSQVIIIIKKILVVSIMKKWKRIEIFEKYSFIEKEAHDAVSKMYLF